MNGNRLMVAIGVYVIGAVLGWACVGLLTAKWLGAI